MQPFGLTAQEAFALAGVVGLRLERFQLVQLLFGERSSHDPVTPSSPSCSRWRIAAAFRDALTCC
jgi:hypothetical protein